MEITLISEFTSFPGLSTPWPLDSGNPWKILPFLSEFILFWRSMNENGQSSLLKIRALLFIIRSSLDLEIESAPCLSSLKPPHPEMLDSNLALGAV
jgi:hypothetical protein